MWNNPIIFIYCSVHNIKFLMSQSLILKLNNNRSGNTLHAMMENPILSCSQLNFLTLLASRELNAVLQLFTVCSHHRISNLTH